MLDIQTLIRTGYDDLSPGQRRVAEFVLTHSAEAIYWPASRIAEEVSVSHSTVVRTAQRLGFEGFPSFQTVLREQFMQRGTAVDRFRAGASEMELGSLDGRPISSVLCQVMESEMEHIQQVLQGLSPSEFERAAELLDQARHVYVIGLRSSASLAASFGMALRYIRPGCTVLHPALGDLPDQLADMGSHDLLLAVSYGRYARDTLRCIEAANQVGAHVVVITDSSLSAAAKRAEVAFVAPVRSWFYVMSAAPQSLVSALLVAVALRRGDSVRARLERLDRIFETFELFERTDALADKLRRLGPDY